ncbi:hypothetical protein VHEMI07476 [[Torrubiella] hemipterigena]|uniref:Ipa protein n=1 Tax=[Torrubiella] hemipterigena TaxID=1531966 RepID=A0A0A1TAI7_9HYPO|nr:hypothetical protein VHEMI07476 [[Torrubiella] hemipterigena]
MDLACEELIAHVKQAQIRFSEQYAKHNLKIEQKWRSFKELDRLKCVNAANGFLLAVREDPARFSHLLVPEFSRLDISSSKPAYLLDILKYRATTPLCEQDTADRDAVRHALSTCFLTKQGVESPGNGLSNEHTCGASSAGIPLEPALLGSPLAGVCEGVSIPTTAPELVLARQAYTLGYLSIIMTKILQYESKERIQPDRQARASLQSSTSSHSPRPLSIPDLISSSKEHAIHLHECATFIASDYEAFTWTVKNAVNGRPHTVPDKAGKLLYLPPRQAFQDAYFETLVSVQQKMFIWFYISELLEVLHSTIDKMHITAILQEISNVCQLEYARSQAMYKRRVQTGTGTGLFRRIPGCSDDTGNPRVVMKGSPDQFTRKDPQLHYVLRLCHPKTTAQDATMWIEKLSTLYKDHEDERARAADDEAESLTDLVMITSLIQDLRMATKLPSPSHKRGLTFISKYTSANAELNSRKENLVSGCILATAHNDPTHRVGGAVEVSFDSHMTQKCVKSIHHLYKSMLQSCLEAIKLQHGQSKLALVDEPHYPLPHMTSRTTAFKVQEKRLKEKTRPAFSEVGGVIATTVEEPTEEVTSAVPIQVSASTAKTFSTLFDKSRARGAVTWSELEAAMAELGFSVESKYGSIYTFTPPATMQGANPLNLHRPHSSKYEGYRVLLLGNRLKRVYDWNMNSFRSK